MTSANKDFWIHNRHFNIKEIGTNVMYGPCLALYFSDAEMALFCLIILPGYRILFIKKILYTFVYFLKLDKVFYSIVLD